MKSLPINWRFLLLSILITLGLFGWGLHRLRVDTDIIGALPKTDSVIADAAYLLLNHPMQNQVVVDVSLKMADLDTLMACGKLVEARLKQSGLFKSVGMEDLHGLMPDMFYHLSAYLPVLFSTEELDNQVLPLLRRAEIQRRLEQIFSGLQGLDSIGQQALISRDPLNLSGLVLRRLTHLVPATGARIYRGNLLSTDGRHLLVIANPIASSTATEFAALIMEQINRIAVEAKQTYGQAGQDVTLTTVGAFRAALDNQYIIKKDIGFAVALSTIAIAVLLLFSFCRPVIGLFSLLPAMAGTMLAYFIFSIFHKSISILALGFGGAIISFTVDQGIAYLLFLDRPYSTFGKAASEEVWDMSLLAVLTTVAAFGTLCFSDFPVFVQLGQFTMLGLGLCFLIVHVLYPRIFPVLPPGGKRSLHLQKVADALGGTGRKGLWAAAIFTVVMVFFAKPVFQVSLQAMNTVGAETLAAEKQVTDVWGGIFENIYMMTEGRSIEELQHQGDVLVEKINSDLASGVLSSGFVPSMVAPGADLRRKNFNAWRAFWSPQRIEDLKRTIGDLSAPMGFADDAFTDFYNMMTATSAPAENDQLLKRFSGLLGISSNSDGSKWIQVATLTTGPAYDAKRFYDAYKGSVKLFDPLFFSKSVGDLLFSTAAQFFLINVLCGFALVAIFLLSWSLTLTCMLPLIFAMISTLATLNILGRPLDIPGMMLSIVIFGLGIDYSIFFVRSYQRNGTLNHPSFGRIRMAVFLSAVTTLFGFGAMWAANHTLLRSIGITAFLGIGYSMIGSFFILPPVLGYIEKRRKNRAVTCHTLQEGVYNRYRDMEAYPRLFARFKMRLDPMFSEMEQMFLTADGIKTILDIGSGYGVPASWLLERFPGARLRGIEPSPERVRVAVMAVGDRGFISQGHAPEIPDVDDPVDLSTMIDMVHFLTDGSFAETLNRLRERTRNGGSLIIRAALPPRRRLPWSWWFQNLLLKLSRVPAYYRTVHQLQSMVVRSGFRMEHTRLSGSDAELVWLVARKA
jgi:predicted exporter/SAM-dependent methyltransferase